ncbi:hypothetical protein [Undibacterium crateris]|uniref:hypothetical protein n=1 Tax=Undibacterium crateris TaxID=2528175 RepID=UPI001389FFB6|nr:hypothetical protein [Undibacterium crateris]NDI85195.1 hypothetical protein [Undibacterium crateris]
MCDLVFSFQEFLKIVPGLVIFPLTFYLTWKKFGTNVSCSVEHKSNRISANQFTNIVLANHKDRPVTIFEISAVLNNDIALIIQKCDPPLVLKPLETISVPADPYSSLYVNGSLWEPDPLFLLNGKLDVYLVTSGDIIKCKKFPIPKVKFIEKFSHLKLASKTTMTFNGVVYSNEKIIYAIVYKANNENKTAFIDSSGLICGDWDYSINVVEPEFMTSTDGVRAFLRQSEADVCYPISTVVRLK